MPTSPKILVLCITCGLLPALLVTGCATEKYEAKPLNIEKTTAKILAKDVANADFKAYLAKQGYHDISTWGLDELTLCALYFNPKLDVAKAQLGLANAQIESAGLKQSPTLNADLARSNQANGDKRPWAYGLNVAIPIEIGNKRAIKIEEAQHLAEVARMDIADTAWQLRSQIAKDLIAHQQNIANTQFLIETLAVTNEITAMLQKRVDTGLISNTELSEAQLLQKKAQAELNNEQAKSAEINAKLASDIGLTTEKFAQIKLKPLDVEATLAAQASKLDAPLQSKTLQQDALLNRIDIRRSLAKYAAAEAKIKLEVAKQRPDISLSPGFLFEFGDSIWSLGFSSLLSLLNKNPTLINEAKQLREIEGAQFEAVQTQIIGELSERYASYNAAKQSLSLAQAQNTAVFNYLQKMQKKLAAGLADRLEVKTAMLGNAGAKQQVLEAQFALLKVANQIEDVMQTPLYNQFKLPN